MLLMVISLENFGSDYLYLSDQNSQLGTFGLDSKLQINCHLDEDKICDTKDLFENKTVQSRHTNDYKSEKFKLNEDRIKDQIENKLQTSSSLSFPYK